VGDHQSGTVKLKDADVGESQIYSFSAADPAGLEPFCINCHDADGAVAGGGTVPFDDGRPVPNIEGVRPVPNIEGVPGSLWADSAHKQMGYAQNGGNPVSCFGDGTSGCHSNAHGSENEKLLSAGAGVTIDQFCYNCHTEGKVPNDALSNNRPGGYVSADDIEEAFGKSRKHDLGTTFTVGANTYELSCTTCHNPHVVTGQHWEVDLGVSPITRPDLTANPTANPRAMGATLWGAVAGEKMDDFAAQASGSGGWYYSTARGGTIAIDQPAVYQPPKAGNGYAFEFGGDVLPDYTTLCLDCHSHRMSAANPPVNWGQGIPCTDNSVDPPNQRVECGADHGLGMAGKPLYISDVGTAGFWGASGNPDVLFQMNYVTRGRHNGHFMRWPYDSAERSAGINFVLSCADCHEAHGSNRGGMIRERFNVNADGDCGAGGNPSPDGENCTDGGNWNSFCNACHYYYGGQHAGMSCGNASCHEANSVHRIIHVTDSGAGTQLMLTAAGYEDSYQRPDFTPEIASVEGLVGSAELAVTFADGVYTHADLTGALRPEDFWLFDVNEDNPRTITAVTHTAGEATAVLTMSAPLTAADHGVDHVTTTGTSIWAWYEGGYENAATGAIGAQAVCAGPWPVTIAGCPVEGPVTFELDEPAGSAVCRDTTGLLSGPVGNPTVTFPGDGTFHGDETADTFIDIDSHPACLLSPRAVTIEARVMPTAVDLDWDDTNGDGIDDNVDRDSTFSRIFERKRNLKITILHADYRGDNIPERDERASIEVKYFVDVASRHTCPHPQWPEDPYIGADARWHQISTDIDSWPIVNNHWYTIRVVFNADKLTIPGSDGTPVDVFIDDQGEDGQSELATELWPGYVNASKTINESSSCKWGALPGDVIATEDQASHIGAPPPAADGTHNALHLFKGQIDYVAWSPGADYSGVDDLPK
jgi:predicted CXXCH cytochrome family protein